MAPLKPSPTKTTSVLSESFQIMLDFFTALGIITAILATLGYALGYFL